MIFKVTKTLAFLLIFTCLHSINLYAAEIESEAVFKNNGQLDSEYYQKLTVKNPQQLINQLQPLLTQPATNENSEVLQNARYLICNAYYYLSQRSKIIPIAQQGLDLAKEQANHKFESGFLALLGIGLLSEGNLTLATDYANQSLGIVNEHFANTAFHGEIALLTAQVFYEAGALQSALRVMVKANSIFTDLKDDNNRSEALASIALIYDELGQTTQAIEYYLKSLELIDIEQNLVEASITYYNIALSYRSNNQNELARSFAERSLQFADKADDKIGAAYAIYELASIAEDKQQYARALTLVNQVLPIFEDNKITGMSILNHLLRARLLAQLGLPGWTDDLKTAEALVDKTSTLKRRIALVRSKANIYEQVKNPSLALQYYKEWVNLKEEQLKETQEQATRRYQAMFELTEAEAKNKLLNTQKKLAETELQAKEFRQWFLIILSIALVIFLAAVISLLVLQIKTKLRFKKLAMIDELTNTRNRRSIATFAHQAIKLAKQNHTDLCFIMIDIDHFKSFNDNFGHDVGDEVLKKVANCISAELRDEDALGRWGGEEWLLVLANSQQKDIDNIFQRIQTQLKKMDLGIEDAPSITVSMGCTYLDNSDSSFKQIIKRADQALYQAKENGRNRLEIKLVNQTSS